VCELESIGSIMVIVTRSFKQGDGNNCHNFGHYTSSCIYLKHTVS
jgi:hypothetical protein